MSGGSYDYLCFCEPGQLFTKGDRLTEMADRLDALGFPEKAQQTRDIFKYLDEIEKRIEPLREAWQAVEWCDSGDTSEDGAREWIRKK